MIHTEGCRVGHPAAETTWAKTTALARETDGATVPALLASDAQKAVHEDATTKVGLELVKHEGRQFAAPRFQICKKRRPVQPFQVVIRARFQVTVSHPAARPRPAACWLRLWDWLVHEWASDYHVIPMLTPPLGDVHRDAGTELRGIGTFEFDAILPAALRSPAVGTRGKSRSRCRARR